MRYLGRCLGAIGLCLLAVSAAASGSEVFLAGRLLALGDDPVFGRITSVQYAPNQGVSFLLRNDSYDDFWYGSMTRWGAAALVPLATGAFQARAGAGLSLTGSPAVAGQLSLDLLLGAAYGVAYAEADHLLYEDGVVGDYALGLNWKIFSGGWAGYVRVGGSGLLVADAAGTSFYPGAFLGLAAGF